MASARSIASSFDSPSTNSQQDSYTSTSVAWARPVLSTSDISPEAVPLPPSPLASPRFQPTALPPLQHKPSRTVLSRGFFASSSNHSSTRSPGSRARPTVSTRSTSDSDGSTNSSLGTLSSIFPQPPPRSSPFRSFPAPLTSSYANAHTTPESQPESEPVARTQRAQEARRKGQRVREQLYKDRTTPRKLKKKGVTARVAEPRGLKRSLSKGFDRLRGKKKAVQVTSISSPFAGDEAQKEQLVKAFYRNGGRLEEEELTPTPWAPCNTPATIHIRKASPSPLLSPPPPLRRKRAKDYTPIPRRVRLPPKLSSTSAKKGINRGRPLPKRHLPGLGPLVTPLPRHNLLRSFAALDVQDPWVDGEKEDWVDDVGNESDVETPLPSGRLVWNSDEEDWSPPSPMVGVETRSSVVGGVDENAASPTPGRWLSSPKLAANDLPIRLPLAPSAQSNTLNYPFADLDPLYTESVWPTGADIIWGNEEQPNVVVVKAQVIGVGTPALAHRASLSDIKSPAHFSQLSASTSSRNRPPPPTPGPPVRHEWSRVASYRATSYESSETACLSVSQSSRSHAGQEGQHISADQWSFHDEESQLGSPTTQRLTLHPSPPTRTISPLRRRFHEDLPPPISPPPSGPLPRPPTFAPCPSTPRLQPGFGTVINSPITLGRSRDSLSSPGSPTDAQAGSSSLPTSPLANRRSRRTPPRLFIPPRSPPRSIIDRESPVDPSSPFSPVRSTIPRSTPPLLGVVSSAPPNHPCTDANPPATAPLSSPTTTPQLRIRRASSSLSLLNRSNSILPSLIARHTRSVASFQPSFSSTTVVELSSASVAWEWEDDASTSTMKGTPSVASASVVAEGAFVESPQVASEREVGRRTSRYGSWKPLKWGRDRI